MFPAFNQQSIDEMVRSRIRPFHNRCSTKIVHEITPQCAPEKVSSIRLNDNSSARHAIKTVLENPTRRIPSGGNPTLPNQSAIISNSYQTNTINRPPCPPSRPIPPAGPRRDPMRKTKHRRGKTVAFNLALYHAPPESSGFFPSFPPLNDRVDAQNVHMRSTTPSMNPRPTAATQFASAALENRAFFARHSNPMEQQGPRGPQRRLHNETHA